MHILTNNPARPSFKARYPRHDRGAGANLPGTLSQRELRRIVMEMIG